MGLTDKLFENERDSKLVRLYTTLTRSDFKGNYEDTYIIECLFALMCLDVNSHIKSGLDFNPKEMMTLAKELVRICEVDHELDIYSFWNWANALLDYMVENKVKVKEVHKMSTYDLRTGVFKYVKTE